MDKSDVEVEFLGKKVKKPFLKFIIGVIVFAIIALLVLAFIGLIVALIGIIGGIMAAMVAFVVGLIVSLPFLAMIHCVFRAFGRRGLFVTKHKADQHNYSIVFHGACEKIEPPHKS